jgi:hypothetical protein
VSAVLLLLLICGLWLMYYAAVMHGMFTLLHMNDFGKFYYAAQMFLDGGDMYGPSPATLIPFDDSPARQFLNVNPPHFHLLLLPLARLSPAVALTVWSLAGVAALIQSVRIAFRETNLSWSPLRLLLVTAAILSFAGFGAVVVTGQLSFLLMLPFTLSWVAARRGQWLAAGLWMGLCVGLKPFLGLFLVYFLAVGSRAAMRGALLSISISFLAGLAIFGIDSHASWVRVLTAVDWHWAPMNASPAGLLARSFSSNPLFEPLADVPSLALTAGIVAALTIVGITSVIASSSNTSLDLSFALMISGSLLASPLGWIYYSWLGLGPGLAVIREWFSKPLLGQATQQWNIPSVVLATASVPGFLCPLYATLYWQPSALATISVGSAYFWSVLFLWLGLLMLKHAAWQAYGFRAVRPNHS